MLSVVDWNIMNERIKELIKEADAKCSETHGVFDEILAEVILKDVLELVEEHRVKFSENWSKRLYGNNLAPGAEWIYNAIKHRYGL